MSGDRDATKVMALRCIGLSLCSFRAKSRNIGVSPYGGFSTSLETNGSG